MKKILHPNAKNIEVDGSIYKQLYTNPNLMYDLINDLVLRWRKKSVNYEKI